MWTQSFFLYNIFSLIIAGSVSAKLKDVQNVDKIVYLNNILLLLNVAVVSMLITGAVMQRYGCDLTGQYNFDYHFSLVLLTFAVISEGFYIALLSQPQISNVPVDVKNLLIVALTLNSLGLIGVGALFAFKLRPISYQL